MVRSDNESISFISKKDSYSHNTYEQVAFSYYSRFKNHIQAFEGEDKQELTSLLYGIYRAQTLRLLKFSIHEDKGELFEALSIQALTIMFQATKKKNIRNVFGYYDAVLHTLIDKALFSDIFMEFDVPLKIQLPW